MKKNTFENHSNFIFKHKKSETLSLNFRHLFSAIPKDYLAFLKSFSKLSNNNETTWFNSISDFNNINIESEFAWNEFELQSINALEGDTENQKKVTQFWDAHLPIILSVKNNYAYFAIGVSEENFGKIFYGEEPEYEEVDLISNNFEDFITMILDQTLEPYLLNLFFEK